MSDLPYDGPLLYDGSLEPPPPPRTLRAGPLELQFDPADCGLHHVRNGESEVLRSVVVSFRGADWVTIPNRLADYHLEEGPDRFALRIAARCRGGDVDFAWTAAVSGAPDGVVNFELEGEARTSFSRTRVGLCVLHPAALAGAPVRVTHVDGMEEEGAFPTEISPHQPFREIRAVSHLVAAGRWATLTFAGAVFEMEDQRNWTDASFKTYGTPLRLPFPVRLEAGARVRQSVTLTLAGDWDGMIGAAAPRRPPWIGLLTRDDTIGWLPRIGLGTASHGGTLSPREQARLRVVHPAHLRLDLDLADARSHGNAPELAASPLRYADPPAARWQERLHWAATQAKQLGTGLEVALHLGDHYERELVALRAELDRLQSPVAAWLVFHEEELSTTARWVDEARRHLDGYEAGGTRPLWGAGSDAHFAQVNRGHPPSDHIDLAVYPICAQSHAFDTASIAESAALHGTTVRNAQRFCSPCRIGVTPVTLRNRTAFGGLLTDPEQGELPAQVDRRQLSLFGAAWTVASLQHLASSGAWSVTYFETTGWRGLMETEAGSPMPEAFPAVPGMVFPMYHVLADVGEFAGAEVLAVDSENASEVAFLGLRQKGRRRVLVANLTASAQCVRMAGLGQARVRVLDETTASVALLKPERFRKHAERIMAPVDGTLSLCLLPYAVARLDAVEPTMS